MFWSSRWSGRVRRASRAVGGKRHERTTADARHRARRLRCPHPRPPRGPTVLREGQGAPHGRLSRSRIRKRSTRRTSPSSCPTGAPIGTTRPPSRLSAREASRLHATRWGRPRLWLGTTFAGKHLRKVESGTDSLTTEKGQLLSRVPFVRFDYGPFTLEEYGVSRRPFWFLSGPAAGTALLEERGSMTLVRNGVLVLVTPTNRHVQARRSAGAGAASRSRRRAISSGRGRACDVHASESASSCSARPSATAPVWSGRPRRRLRTSSASLWPRRD